MIHHDHAQTNLSSVQTMASFQNRYFNRSSSHEICNGLLYICTVHQGELPKAVKTTTKSAKDNYVYVHYTQTIIRPFSRMMFHAIFSHICAPTPKATAPSKAHMHASCISIQDRENTTYMPAYTAINLALA